MSASEPRKYRSLDVRPLLARGEEPLPKIMAAVEALRSGEGLVITAPFLPSPLIERLHAAGFQARPERSDDGAWKTFFWRD
jgi:uncharacterized protein (DUF2249 family)